jgi:hypothetical protein
MLPVERLHRPRIRLVLGCRRAAASDQAAPEAARVRHQVPLARQAGKWVDKQHPGCGS